MAELWEPGALMEKIAKATMAGNLSVRDSLAELARGIETEAKVNLALTSHRFEQPTASTPGQPPSLVSGTLRRSVTHDPVTPEGSDWVTKVGTASNHYPTYRLKRGGTAKTNTPSSKYGLYLETGLRNGSTYPWLRPAFDEVYHEGVMAELARANFNKLMRW